MHPSCKLRGHLTQSTYPGDLKGLTAPTLNIAATSALDYLVSDHPGSADTPFLIPLTEQCCLLSAQVCGD